MRRWIDGRLVPVFRHIDDGLFGARLDMDEGPVPIYARLKYLLPRDPPNESKWGEELDFPGVSLQIMLPAQTNLGEWTLLPALCGSELLLCDAALGPLWGVPVYNETPKGAYRAKSVAFYKPWLVESRSTGLGRDGSGC
jgi:hypothetical protein